MKVIRIRNVGALRDVEIKLNRLNIIIGPQSLGKSTVLKVASFCCWVEKRIELTQDYSQFAQEGTFVSELVEFHKLGGYLKPDSFIEYQSDYMRFSYDNLSGKFYFEWGEGRWNYYRPQISYIPSERNLVAAIPNWYEVTMGRNNIRNFMTDWETARQSITDELEILDLNVSYHFESSGKKDKVMHHHASPLDFTNTSSGLQSLIPLFVHLNYLYDTQFRVEQDRKISGDWENEELLRIIYKELYVKTGKTDAVHSVEREKGDGSVEKVNVRFRMDVGTLSFFFSYPSYARECQEIFNRYQMTDHCEIFLEEPENNLFPPTQDNLVKWLLDKTLHERSNTLFVATHSPYILSSFMEEHDLPLSLFFVYEKDGESRVKAATNDDIRTIYDYGIDAFYNLENIVSE